MNFKEFFDKLSDEQKDYYVQTHLMEGISPQELEELRVQARPIADKINQKTAFDKLSIRHKNEFDVYSLICKKLFHFEEKIPLNVELNSDFLENNLQICFDMKISYHWDFDKTGFVKVDLYQNNSIVIDYFDDSEFTYRLAQTILPIYQAKIDKINQKIDLWEKETGLSFATYCS